MHACNNEIHQTAQTSRMGQRRHNLSSIDFSTKSDSKFLSFTDNTKTEIISHINFQILFNTKIDQTKEVFLITTMQERSF